MSLATRCTHCGTIFKVVQDQLKVSEGWVRCGRCNEVFNALPGLFDLEKDPPPPRPLGAQASPTHEPPHEPAAAGGVAEPHATSTFDPPAPAAGPATSEGEDTAAALASQGLLSDEDIALGIESRPPGDWARTQPADYASSLFPPQAAEASEPLREDDLSLEPEPIEGTTDFELDTAIAIDDNTPLEVVLAVAEGRPVPRHLSGAPTAASAAARAPLTPEGQPDTAPRWPAAPQPSSDRRLADDDLTDGAQDGFTTQRAWPAPPPDDADVPSTDEADALDSRYLLPSDREPRVRRRRGSGPEFADAEFPTDAMIDAEEDWASDFGPSSLEHDTPPPEPAAPRAATPAMPRALGLRQPAAIPTADRQREDDTPTLPSRFPSDVESEQEGLPPPSSREGRPGTRGRDPNSQTPEFIKRAQRQALWRHPAMRALLSVLILGLMLSLALQLAHQFRDLIAAYHPASRPLLAEWCRIAGCELAPPLRLEALQVDNLELVRTSSEGPDRYRLTVVVRNQAGIDVAWPHVDLTLTDETGAVIARRVFSPHDAQWLDTADPKADSKADGAHSLASPPGMPAAAPRQRSTTLQWRLKASDLHPAGYTAELFYP